MFTSFTKLEHRLGQVSPCFPFFIGSSKASADAVVVIAAQKSGTVVINRGKTSGGKASANTLNSKTSGGETPEVSRYNKTSGGKAVVDSRNSKTSGGKAAVNSRNSKTSGGKAAVDSCNSKTSGGKALAGVLCSINSNKTTPKHLFLTNYFTKNNKSYGRNS